MKSIIISLILAGLLFSSVFAQETKQAEQKTPAERAQMKAERDKKIKEGKAAGQRAIKNRKNKSKFEAAQNPNKEKPRKKPKKSE